MKFDIKAVLFLVALVIFGMMLGSYITVKSVIPIDKHRVMIYGEIHEYKYE